MLGVCVSVVLQGKSMDDFVPRFVWTLRDFSLRLVDEDGDAITPNEYMVRNDMLQYFHRND